MGIYCMSLAVWLVEDRKCSAAVEGLDLVIRLSMVRPCSLNRSRFIVLNQGRFFCHPAHEAHRPYKGEI